MGGTYNGFAGIRDYAQFYIVDLKIRAKCISLVFSNLQYVNVRKNA